MDICGFRGCKEQPRSFAVELSVSFRICIFVTLLGVTASKIEDDAELSGLSPLVVPSSEELGARMGRQEWEGECLNN